MGWIRKAAKLAPEIAEKLRHDTKLAQSGGDIAKRFSDMLSSDIAQYIKKSNPGVSTSVARQRVLANSREGINFMRKISGRNPKDSVVMGGVGVNRYVKSARELKAELPKVYQRLKDYVSSGYNHNKVERVAKMKKIAEDYGLGNKVVAKTAQRRTMRAGMLRELRASSVGRPNDVIRYMSELAKRGILPAASVGAGVAASRSKGKQGYAYGGVVRRAKKGR
jgi:hypothetical protein